MQLLLLLGSLHKAVPSSGKNIVNEDLGNLERTHRGVLRSEAIGLDGVRGCVVYSMGMVGTKSERLTTLDWSLVV